MTLFRIGHYVIQEFDIEYIELNNKDELNIELRIHLHNQKEVLMTIVKKTEADEIIQKLTN
jgi:hypothetical protein